MLSTPCTITVYVLTRCHGFVAETCIDRGGNWITQLDFQFLHVVPVGGGEIRIIVKCRVGTTRDQAIGAALSLTHS